MTLIQKRTKLFQQKNRIVIGIFWFVGSIQITLFGTKAGYNPVRWLIIIEYIGKLGGILSGNISYSKGISRCRNANRFEILEICQCILIGIRLIGDKLRFFQRLYIRYTKPTFWLDCGFRLWKLNAQYLCIPSANPKNTTRQKDVFIISNSNLFDGLTTPAICENISFFKIAGFWLSLF